MAPSRSRIRAAATPTMAGGASRVVAAFSALIFVLHYGCVSAEAVAEVEVQANAATVGGTLPPGAAQSTRSRSTAFAELQARHLASHVWRGIQHSSRKYHAWSHTTEGLV